MGTKFITTDVWILIGTQTFSWLTTSAQSHELGQLLMSSENLDEIIVCKSQRRVGGYGLTLVVKSFLAGSLFGFV